MANENKPFDFWLSIDPRGDGSYEIAARSPTGDSRATARLDGIRPTADRFVSTVTAEWRSQSANRSTDRTVTPVDFNITLRDTGRRLFDAIMVDGVHKRYRSDYDIAWREKRDLRIRLRIQAPELAGLPWEFLYDAEHEQFLARNTFTSVMRYVEVDLKSDTLQVTPPLSVLGVIAGPTDQVALEKDVERERIERALASLTRSGRVRIHWTANGTYDEFANALQQYAPHIVHFIGHGDFDAGRNEGMLLFEQADGTSHPIYAEKLGEQLLGHQTVRFVVLNSCEGARSGTSLFSSTAATLVRRGIPAVVAMQYPISDKAAILFSTQLYRGLQQQQPVDAAVSDARVQMHAADEWSPEWGTPVLFLQSESGIIFDFPSNVGLGGRILSWARRLGGWATWLAAIAFLLLLVIVFVALAASQERNGADRLEAAFASLRNDTTPRGRAAALTSLQAQPLRYGLENKAAYLLVQLIRSEHMMTVACAPSGDGRRTAPAELDFLRHLQNQSDRKTRFGRFMDGFISRASGSGRPPPGVVLDSVDLRNADLRRLNLPNASFRFACLPGAVFDTSNLAHTTFEGARLDAVSFDSTRLDSANFTGAIGPGTTFYKSSLVETDFSFADLRGADLLGAQAHCAIFLGAILDSARFEQVQASWASFEGASLVGVRRLGEANLEGATFMNPRVPFDSQAYDALRRRGAGPLDIDRKTWVDGRLRELRREGICGRAKVR